MQFWPVKTRFGAGAFFCTPEIPKIEFSLLQPPFSLYFPSQSPANAALLEWLAPNPDFYLFLRCHHCFPCNYCFPSIFPPFSQPALRHRSRFALCLSAGWPQIRISTHSYSSRFALCWLLPIPTARASRFAGCWLAPNPDFYPFLQLALRASRFPLNGWPQIRISTHFYSLLAPNPDFYPFLLRTRKSNPIQS